MPAGLSGAMAMNAPLTSEGYGHGGEIRQRGVAGKFLDSKGFGWLMEVGEEDDDSQVPLL